MATTDQASETGPWDGSALAILREWDPAWADQCLRMSKNPWTSGILLKRGRRAMRS